MVALILMKLKTLNPNDKEYPKDLDCSWYILKLVSHIINLNLYNILFEQNNNFITNNNNIIIIVIILLLF